MDEEKKSSICRVCLNSHISQNETGLYLFEKYNDSLISDKIKSIANVKITEGDGLPDMICSKCLLDLETAINFKEKCENSNIALHTKALNSKTLQGDIDISVKDENRIEYEYEYLNDGEHSIQEFDDAKFETKKLSHEVVDKIKDLKLECHDCGGLFKTKCKLRVHWKKMHQQSQLICVSCRATFKSYRALHIHRKKTIQSCKLASNFHIEGQGKSRVFCCKVCNYKSKYIKGLSTHMVSHSETDIHVEKEKPTEYTNEINDDIVCVAQFNQAEVKTETPIKEAVGRKSRAIDLKLECYDCGGFFKSKCKLRVHWKNVHLQSQIVCHNCKTTFKSFKALHMHMERMTQICKSASYFHIEGQGKSRVFHCKECNFKSMSLSSLSSHMLVHTGERPFKCDLCPRGFTQHSSLQAHKEVSHKTYLVEATCQHCGKHIKGRSKLYSHMKQHKQNYVQCTVCQKYCKGKTSLTEHMKTHSQFKAYSCEVCGKRFYTNSARNNHRNEVHIKNKKYKCNLCEYASYKSGIIKRHILKHTGTNVPCLVCGRFLDNAQQLMLHEKRHFDKNLPCLHCDQKFFSRSTLSSHVREKHKCTMLVNKVPNGNVESGSESKLILK